MRRYLPLLFILFPALELWVLILVGSEIGALATIGLVILSSVVGISILRLRGLHIARTMQAELAAGRLPSGQIADTFCLMIAGWLFLFPGFVSDVLALILIIPGMRHLLLSFALNRMRAHGFQGQTVHVAAPDGSGPVTWTCTTFGGDSQQRPGNSRTELHGNAVVIDCEAEDVTPGDTPDKSR